MRNNRGVLLVASAIVWSGMIWGMAHIKPTFFTPDLPDPPPPILTVPIKPEIIEPPPPPTRDETEQTPEIHRTPIAALPTKARVRIKTEEYNGPPIGEIEVKGEVADTAPPFIGPPKTPEVKELQIAAIEDICEEEARNPRPLSPFNVERAYPTRLEEQEITGIVNAIWEIDSNGLPIEVRVQSSSDPGFNNAVVNEGMKMRFRPARKECENIKGIYALNVKFELNGEQ